MHTNSEAMVISNPSAHAPTGAPEGAVLLQGDFPSDRMSITMPVFEELLGHMQMRQLAFEPCSRTFRPHSAKALTILQRLKRLQGTIAASESRCPGITEAAERLTEITEMSDTISWSMT